MVSGGIGFLPKRNAAPPLGGKAIQIMMVFGLTNDIHASPGGSKRTCHSPRKTRGCPGAAAIPGPMGLPWNFLLEKDGRS
jgi:hypothetical protein